MIPILFDSNETAFTSNGIGRLIDCISCVVVEERNGIYECDFEYPVDGQYYDMIKCGRIIGVKHDDSNDIQPFDIVSFTKPIDGIVSFHAVHISYRLKGYVVTDSNINSLSDALTALASASPSNSFTYTADYTSNGYAGAFNGVPRSVRELLGGVEGSILDTYGGEYEWDKFSVILHQHRGTAVDFAVRYGYNMTDYNNEVDYSNSYTSAIPYWIGTDENGDEVKVIGNKVSSGLTPYNGMEKCVAMDLTDKFEAEPTTAELEAFALNKMTSDDVNNPHQSIDVAFVRLQDFSEYSGYSNLLQCKLCDSVQVIFQDYQTSASFKIVRIEYDVLEERFSSMELGTLSITLAEALGLNNSSSEYRGSSGGGGGSAVTGVKGDTEINYRTGNVNLTAANIGAVPTTRTVNGKALSSNITLSASDVSALPSSTAIHNVPSGGTSGQVLSKASGTDYDLTWSNVSAGVTDVQVNGTSVVSSNVANVPVSRSNVYGVIKTIHDNDPPGGVLGITYYNSLGQETTGYAPLTVYSSGAYQPIRAKFLPDASTTEKGAMSASDKVKLNGIASGAEVNVQSNWNEADSSSDAYILNKPTIPTVLVDDVQINGTSIVSSKIANIKTMTGATSSAGGDKGLVPTPAMGKQNNVLFGDGTWDYYHFQNVPQSTSVSLLFDRYNANETLQTITLAAATTTAAGVMSASDKTVVNSIPSGGTAGQVLAKASGTNYDFEWVNQSGGGGSTEYDFTTTLTPSISSTYNGTYLITPTNTADLTVSNCIKVRAYLVSGTTIYPLAPPHYITINNSATVTIQAKNNYGSTASGTLHIVAPFAISSVSSAK